jgi:hypothetical protein
MGCGTFFASHHTGLAVAFHTSFRFLQEEEKKVKQIWIENSTHLINKENR